MSNPYESPESDISTPNDNKPFEYVGFWIRVVATLIDTILVLMIIAPIAISLFGTDYYLDANREFQWFDLLLNYVLPAIAVTVFWKFGSATPGKMVFKAVIVDAKTGKKLTTRQIIIRYLGYYISMLPLLLGMMWVGWDKKKQGFHDKLAGTVVIRYINNDNETG